MVELPIASARANQEPPIILQQLDELPYFHWRSMPKLIASIALFETESKGSAVLVFIAFHLIEPDPYFPSFVWRKGGSDKAFSGDILLSFILPDNFIAYQPRPNDIEY